MKIIKQIIWILCCAVIAGCASRTEPDPPSTEVKQHASAVPKFVLPTPEEISSFQADPLPARSHFPEYEIDRKVLSEVLTSWHQVSAEHWWHGYSHVAMEDRTGTIGLNNGKTIRWRVRPGGLATLSLPDGHMIHLARERTQWKKIAEPKNGFRQ